ncbi:hypothetical protein [Methylobacterium oryzae]|uniref:hypothetical protein n=1 Tax=Methylobacterium oryzae TaxID=334852 RepID=UPI002F335B99
MLRRLSLSYWTPVVAGLVLLGLHLTWAIRWEPAKRGEAVTGFGACLIVLGLLVAARPYIRAGRQGMYDAARPRHPGAFAMAQGSSARFRARVEASEPERRRDVDAERIYAVAVIVAGTLLNGYGSPLVRLFGLEG